MDRRSWYSRIEVEEDSQVGQGQIFTAGNFELRFEEHEKHDAEREISGQRNNTKRKERERKERSLVVLALQEERFSFYPLLTCGFQQQKTREV